MVPYNRRSLAWLGALAAATVVAVSHGRDLRRRRAAEHFAALSVARLGPTEACLLGPGGAPADARQATQRARARALAPGGVPMGWPARCVDTLDDALQGPPHVAASESAARAVTHAALVLRDALATPESTREPMDFRDGRAAWTTPPWVAPLEHYDHAVGALGRLHGLPGPDSRLSASPLRALPSLSADVVPLPLSVGAILAGANYAAGTLALEFIDPTHRRLLCRSRDRGESIACHWLTPPDHATAVLLVRHDRAEALVLVDRDGTDFVDPADALGTGVFPLGASAARTFALRVFNDTLYAMVDTPAGAALERVSRGGAAMARQPADVSPTAEAAMLTPDAPGVSPGAWWLAAATDHDAPVLVARRLPDNLASPPTPPVRIATLGSPTALLEPCEAQDVGYVAVLDAPVGSLVATDALGPPRVIGSLAPPDLPATLVCDADGATVIGATTVQSCRRQGGCTPPWTARGVRAFARSDGSLTEVLAAAGGGLRIRHGAPEQLNTRPMIPLADDAAHGGVDAQALWLFAAGDHLVLITLGDTHTVLWSADAGTSWHPARETQGAPGE